MVTCTTLSLVGGLRADEPRVQLVYLVIILTGLQENPFSLGVGFKPGGFRVCSFALLLLRQEGVPQAMRTRRQTVIRTE